MYKPQETDGLLDCVWWLFILHLTHSPLHIVYCGSLLTAGTTNNTSSTADQIHIKKCWTYLKTVFWQLKKKMRIGPKSSASSFSYPFSTFFVEHYSILSSRCLSSENALTHQRGHVSSVHLPCGDLLLRCGHSAHIEGVGAADGPRPNYTWKCNRAVLHATHPVKLLLQNCGSETGKKRWMFN